MITGSQIVSRKIEISIDSVFALLKIASLAKQTVNARYLGIDTLYDSLTDLEETLQEFGRFP